MDLNGVATGANPLGLTLAGDKFYGVTTAGGEFDKGILFEWDPATNIFIKKKDFNLLEGSVTGMLTRADAPVTKGLSNSCETFPSVTINNSNNNSFTLEIF